MNKIVYTCLFGDYEDLKTPTVMTEGWEYYCVTDNALLTVPGWRIIYARVMDCGEQRTARYYKINFHKLFPTAQYILYLDCSFQINVELNTFWDRYFKSPFSCPAHPIRNCVYREVESCIVNRRGDEEEIRRQGEAYKLQNIPHFNGVITSGVLLRQNTPECVSLCEAWWEELSKYSARDQIAFANVSRRYRFHTFVWDYSVSKELKYIKHYHKRH